MALSLREATRFAVRVQASGLLLCRHSRTADSFATRLRGLLGKCGFEDSDGLLLRPSNAIHTWGMAFAIDAVALDGKGRVVGVRSRLAPRRVAFFGSRSREVLELPAGAVERTGVRVGDRLLFSESEENAGPSLRSG